MCLMIWWEIPGTGLRKVSNISKLLSYRRALQLIGKVSKNINKFDTICIINTDSSKDSTASSNIYSGLSKFKNVRQKQLNSVNMGFI